MSRLRDRSGIAILICALLACCCCKNPNEVQAPAPIAKGPLYNGPAQQTRSFKISSSRFLPTGLQGFQLGMTISDARNRMPNLKSDPAQKSMRLYGETPEGFSVVLHFSGNRLYSIESELIRINPRDADAFDRSTIMQLGKPHVSLYKGPDSRCWLWIDGDVRDGMRMGNYLTASRVCLNLTSLITQRCCLPWTPHKRAGMDPFSRHAQRRINVPEHVPAQTAFEVSTKCVFTNTSHVSAPIAARAAPKATTTWSGRSTPPRPRWASTASRCAGAIKSARRDLPYKTASDVTYDSGDFAALTKEALELADGKGFARPQAREPQARQIARPRRRQFSGSDGAARQGNGRHNDSTMTAR